jgi:hypothetical protein
VIAHNPRIVGERIEAANHGRAPRFQAELGALVDVADVDEDGVRVRSPPLPDLGGATGQATKIGMTLIIDRGENVAVQIGRVQNGDGDGIRLLRPKRTRQRGEQGPLPECAQESAPAKRRHMDVHAFFRLVFGVFNENKLDKVRP